MGRKHKPPSLWLAGFALAPLAMLLPSAPVAKASGVTIPPLHPLVALKGSPAPTLGKGPVLLGAAQAERPLRLDVTLRLPHPQALQEFLADLSDQSSPLYHHFLRRGQFGERFGPSLAELQQVETVLEEEGFRLDSVASDRLAIHLSTTVGTAEVALHTTIGRYRLAGGQDVFANESKPMVPAAIAGDVQGIIGLNDLQRAQSVALRELSPDPHTRSLETTMRPAVTHTAGPQPCADATDAAAYYDSYTANDLASYYSMTPLYEMGDLGQDVHVALIEFEPNLESDISAYAKCYGISPHVDYHEIDGGAGSGAGSGEAALDIEDVMGLAPDATIDVYQAPNTGTSNYDDYEAVIDQDSDQVISTSWGLCELDVLSESGSSYLEAEQALFEQANSQGETVFASAGDTGSTDCLDDPGSTQQSSLSVEDPAGQPYVVGVGGTSIGTGSEDVWNDGSGAGGGGVSSTFCMPSYQDQSAIPGLVNQDSQVDSTNCASSSSNALLRQVPDVSADAAPETGYVAYYEGLWQGGWGGTSAATPLWAAVAALIDDSPFCSDYGSGDPGVLPEGLYEVASADSSYIYDEPNGAHEALYDVTSGDNDDTASGYSGGLYPATAGYDMASGLGTPIVSGRTSSGSSSAFYPGLAALMCWNYRTKLASSSITAVSPDIGATSAATTVTITGTGFLPIAGADELLVGSKTAVASCTSTTRCTAVLPTSTARTVNLRMIVEDGLTESPVSAADEFSYEVAPDVRVTSPTLAFELDKTLPVRYSVAGASSPVAAYDVRYRAARWNSEYYGDYVYPSSWQGTTSSSVELTHAMAGDEYCFSARARLQSGLYSSWSPDDCTALPLSAKSLRPVTAGWTRHSGAAYYLHSYLETTTERAELRLVGAEIGQVAPVVTKCPSCGRLAVYVNGRLLRTVNTYAPTTRHGVVIQLPSIALRRATITLEAASKGRLIIEGLGVA